MNQTKWDEKAANYVRFSHKPDTFQQRVFDTLETWGVEFTDKNILDIGCGTGAYTLHLAQKAAHVDALDFSEEMLNVLQNDAKSYGIHNIKAIHERFDTLLCKARYDLAFCSMSPAVSSPAMFEKMHACAKEKVFLGWGGKRKSSLHDAIFEAFGTKYNAPRGGIELKAWLETQNIFFTCKVLEETRTSYADVQKSVENVTWHLGINGVTFDPKALYTLVENAADAQGMVENVIESEMVLLVF
ncbi:MAG: class I SAM-dependent methyltransferase [Campylobacterales bacterium]|nr:class I SAM-dependent methyltransferase [Campylobacterales bacterium]